MHMLNFLDTFSMGVTNNVKTSTIDDNAEATGRRNKQDDETEDGIDQESSPTIVAHPKPVFVMFVLLYVYDSELCSCF